MTGHSKTSASSMTSPSAAGTIQIANLENQFFKDQLAKKAISEVMDFIITRGAKIIFKKYIGTQKIPYASRVLTRELIMNASWVEEPLGFPDVTVFEDGDLELPPIDEWASGVLPITQVEFTNLRPAQVNTREFRNIIKPSQPVSPHAKQATTAPPRVMHVAPKNKEIKTKKREVTVSEKIIQTFEEQRKKVGAGAKNITVDAEFNIIPVEEPKNSNIHLIVPKIATKKQIDHTKKVAKTANPPKSPNKPVVTPRRKPKPKLLDPDSPVFDDAAVNENIADKFVPNPGVTLKDGDRVKSKPLVKKQDQLSRVEYQRYLENVKKNS